MPDQTTVTVPPPKEAAPTLAPLPHRAHSGVVVSTAKYLARTDVHTFAFSFAANSILSFFPFVVLLLSLIHI